MGMVMSLLEAEKCDSKAIGSASKHVIWRDDDESYSVLHAKSAEAVRR